MNKLADYNDLHPSLHPNPSPIQKTVIQDRIVYIKRDDLLRLPESGISGNKARKMLSLNLIPLKNFPECLASYGGPQSNSMLALAAVVRSKKKRFVYYTKKIPRWLRATPSGNYLRAKSLGMEAVELSNEEYARCFGDESARDLPPLNLDPPAFGSSVWVPQGGACGLAMCGVSRLANEIVSFWEQEQPFAPLAVCVPSGTCTTALFLHLEIQKLIVGKKLDITVVCIPCVGGVDYAKKQMISLHQSIGTGHESNLPDVLLPLPDKKHPDKRRREGRYYTFGEPHLDIFNTYRTMKDEYNVYLDLIYGAPAWTILLQCWNLRTRQTPISGRQVMYVHSGGLEGISSQITRYKHRGLISPDSLQETL